MKVSPGPVELWDPTLAVLDAASAATGCPLTTGLEWLRVLVGADRADGGYVSSTASVYRPSVSVAGAGQVTADFTLPAGDPIMSAILAVEGAVAVGDLTNEVPDGLCRATMLNLDTRSMVARRLAVDERVFGLVCLDWVGVPTTADGQLVELVDLFVSSVLAPILLLVSGGRGRTDTPLLDSLSEAERAAVLLAASGLSYAEIADALEKSVHTVDHQLLSARAPARGQEHIPAGQDARYRARVRESVRARGPIAEYRH